MMSLSLSARDNCEVSFTVTPKMSCANCEKKIKSNLRFEKGVKAVSTSLSDQKVNVTFDPDKTDEKKLTDAFKKIGYKAVVVKPEKKSEPQGTKK